jgi:hypothetical protein
VSLLEDRTGAVTIKGESMRVMLMLVFMLMTAEFFGVSGTAAGQITDEKQS